METIEIIMLSAVLLFVGFVAFNLLKKKKVVDTPNVGGGGGSELPIEDPEKPIKPVELEKSEIN